MKLKYRYDLPNFGVIGATVHLVTYNKHQWLEAYTKFYVNKLFSFF